MSSESTAVTVTFAVWTPGSSEVKGICFSEEHFGILNDQLTKPTGACLDVVTTGG
jgi:hypothetical protein